MSLPQLNYLTLELTAACNYSCVMCRSHMRRKKAGDPFAADRPEMTIEAFKDLVDQAIALNPNVIINPQKSGESSLHPDIHEAIRYVKARGAQFIMTNNGSMMDAKLRRTILENKCDQVVVSIDGATKGVFEKIRGSDWRDAEGRSPYEATVQNTLALLEERDRLGQKEPHVTIAFCLQPSNWHEVDALKAFWGPRADAIGIFNVIMTTEYQRYFYKDFLEQRKPCQFLWNELHVFSDGTAVNCSVDGKARNPVGNALKTPLAEIWHGEYMEQMRRHHEAAEFGHYATCANCDFWSPREPVRSGFELLTSTSKEYFLEKYVFMAYETYSRRPICELNNVMAAVGGKPENPPPRLGLRERASRTIRRLMAEGVD